MDTKTKINQLVAQTGSLGIFNVDGEDILRVVVEGAGPANTLQISARLVGQESFVLLKEIVGPANEKVRVSTYEEIKIECTAVDPLDVAIKVIASSFNEASGSAIQIDVPAGESINEIEILTLTSSDNSVIISGDNTTKVIDLKANVNLDDVQEYPSLANFPAIGLPNTLYVALDTELIYRFSGTVYIEVSPSAVKSVNTQTGDVVLTKSDIGLSDVDNTSDADKPISTATQSALDLKQDSLGFTPEDSANKSSDTSLGNSDTLYPTQNAVKVYVDNSIASGSAPDATTLSKGIIQLAGDLSGTAEAPTVPGLADKYDASNPAGYITLAEVPSAPVTSVNTQTGDVVLTKSDIGLDQVDNTSDADKPISSATQTALNLKQDSLGFTPEDSANKSDDSLLGTSSVLYPTQKAVKEYVDNSIASGSAPDATTTTKGIIKLAGDLGGTADAPTVPALADKYDASNPAGYITIAEIPAAPVTSVNTQTGDVVLTKSDVGLDQVDNTSDADKPISTATATALSSKVESASNLGSGEGVFSSKVGTDLQLKSIVAGTNVSLSSDANSITINASGGTAPVTSVNTKVGDVVLDKTDIGLSNVDNTSDADKPISTATATALSGKADTVHTHVATDVTDFSEAVDDRVNSLLVAGSNITLTYNDLTDTLTIDAAGAPASTSAERLITTAFNATGSIVPKMTVIYLSGVQGDRPRIALAQANSEATSSKTYGLVQTDIADMTDGIIVEQGRLENLDTDIVGWVEGDPLWLSPTVAGGITNVKPSAPNHAVFIGYLIRKHQNVGVIQVSIQNGYELQELHNVSISDIADAQVIAYENSTSLWKNKTLTKSDVGLSNVDNTSDADKPISTATSTALSGKQDTLVSGTNIKTINGNSVLGSGDLVIGGGGSSISIEDEGTQITSAAVSINFTGDAVTATSDVSGNVTVDIQGGSGAVSSVNGQTGDVVITTSWGEIAGTLADQTDLQSALDAKQNSLGFTAENSANKSTDTGLGTSNILYPTQNAVKTYVDNVVAAGVGVTSVNGQTGVVVINKTDIGLGNVDNTSDVDKPVSTATQTAINEKVSKAGDTMTGTLIINPASGDAANLNARTIIDGLDIGHPYGAGFLFIQPTADSQDQLYINTADQTSVSGVVSKQLVIQSGYTLNANTGRILISTGVPSTTGNSGQVQILTAAAAGGTSGYIDIVTGTGLNATGGLFIASGTATPTTSANTGTVAVVSGRSDSTTAGNTGGTTFGSGRIVSNTSTGNTGGTRLQTGNVAGTGNSGSIDIETGTVTSGTRGEIRIRARNTWISGTNNFGIVQVNDDGTFTKSQLMVFSNDYSTFFHADYRNNQYPSVWMTGSNHDNTKFMQFGAFGSTSTNAGGAAFKGAHVQGTVSGTYNGGDVYVETQSASFFNDTADNLEISSGSLYLKTNNAFVKGTGTSANSGSIFIQTGTSAGTGTRGSVTIQASELNMDNNKITRTSEFYLGDPNFDGTYRIRPDGNNLVTERRESGVWVVKQTITP